VSDDDLGHVLFHALNRARLASAGGDELPEDDAATVFLGTTTAKMELVIDVEALDDSMAVGDPLEPVAVGTMAMGIIGVTGADAIDSAAVVHGIEVYASPPGDDGARAELVRRLRERAGIPAPVTVRIGEALYGVPRGRELLAELADQVECDGRGIIATEWAMFRAADVAMRSLINSTAALGAVAAGSIREAGDTADADKIEALANWLRCALLEITERSEWNANPDALERNGLLWLDAMAVDVLESMGAEGKRAAKRAREQWGEEHAEWSGTAPTLPGVVNPVTWRAVWCRWLDPEPVITPVRFAHTLAFVGWCDVVRPALEEAKTPTLPLGYQSHAVRVNFRPGRRIEEQGNRLAVLGPAGVVVGRIMETPAVAGIPEGLFTRGIAAAASMTTHRLFRWLPATARAQVLRDRLDLTRAVPRIVIPGGLGALAEKIGAGKGHAAQVRDTLDWLQHAHAIGEEGTEHHGLLTWSETRGHRGQRAEVEIIPSKALLLGGGRGKLTPVPHSLPRFFGGNRGHSAQASLQLLVMDELRVRARELAEQGGVKITQHDWERLADQAGLRSVVLDKLLDVWIDDDPNDPDGGRAFLRLLPGDRWTLAEAYVAELECLIEAGNWDAGSSERGKRSARKRRGAALRKRGAGGA
jgi:hypothetical protein